MLFSRLKIACSCSPTVQLKFINVQFRTGKCAVALVNAKRLRRLLTVLQTRNKLTFCDIPSNADLSIACAAEQLFV